MGMLPLIPDQTVPLTIERSMAGWVTGLNQAL